MKKITSPTSKFYLNPFSKHGNCYHCYLGYENFWDDAKKIDHHIETENFFIGEVYSPCFVHDIYWYLSKNEGGAIPYQGKSYWSGNVQALNDECHDYIYDMGSFEGCCCMAHADIESIMCEHFPDLCADFNLVDGIIEVFIKE